MVFRPPGTERTSGALRPAGARREYLSLRLDSELFIDMKATTPHVKNTQLHVKLKLHLMFTSEKVSVSSEMYSRAQNLLLPKKQSLQLGTSAKFSQPELVSRFGVSKVFQASPTSIKYINTPEILLSMKS